MKSKTMKRSRKTAKSEPANLVFYDARAERQVRCYHCGGALKTAEEGAKCVMCGRYAEHRCDNCIYHEGGKVAA
ncbi:MAG: hypothetical protein ACNS63_08650 [Candidatus Nitrospinota bacterium M3_3B_026]